MGTECTVCGDDSEAGARGCWMCRGTASGTRETFKEQQEKTEGVKEAVPSQGEEEASSSGGPARQHGESEEHQAEDCHDPECGCRGKQPRTQEEWYEVGAEVQRSRAIQEEEEAEGE